MRYCLSGIIAAPMEKAMTDNTSPAIIAAVQIPHHILDIPLVGIDPPKDERDQVSDSKAQQQYDTNNPQSRFARLKHLDQNQHETYEANNSQ
jgi:hypothetical protein